MTQIHIKENSKNICPFAHILMYMGLRVISACIREKWFKSRVCQIKGIFRDDIGNIKGTKSLQRDREGHVYVIYHVW